MGYGYIGKKVRLQRILRDGKAVIFAFDHGVEHGPADFPGETIDPRKILSKVVDVVDAIMLLPGMASLTHEVWAGKIPLIVKVTSKTSLRPEQEKLLQSPFGFVEDVVALGAEAVAATVYWGSNFEDQMLKMWFEVKREAERYGLPALQLSYPRGPAIKNMYDVEVVRYGVRAAIESGADLIKTYYTGSTESFRRVVEVAAGVPVLMSGGAKAKTLLDFLYVVKSVMDAGAQGVVVGRNIFQHENPRGAAKAIMAVVHEGYSPEEALKMAEQ
ncbi:fructose-1,6-bisphosphate aldolase [Thermofilum adornatum 1505]|jgi:class I fructose-bisphosphate aldolase|uniref:fructose-bisphosphate aldolase n=2 Tax=Thermofilum adornatum TaxID=1365176 RepID=A0A3G1A8E0_9CREN|nr:class I fructose-bisphosphate aldolase [Thermofilum adornatum]AJB41641.1 fructose-1,6-bisphosphate aldolase [Thermofilum adornatum 1505]